MIRGIYNAASAMVARSKQQDVTSSNLANAGAAGYKRRSVFLRRLSDAQNPAEKPWLQPLAEGTYTDFSQGVLEPTGEAFDAAIDGEGFFVVNTPQGERFTRNGDFSLSPSGELVTANGYQVLGDGGPIALPDGELVIGEQGQVYVDGAQVGNLRVVTFANPQNLESVGGALYSSNEGSVPADAATVRQGYVENANLDIVQEMVHMMTSFRYFETAQKAVQMQDETLNQAVNNIGKVKRA